MAKKTAKTNVMRILDANGKEYKEHTYEGGALSGTQVAEQLGQEVGRVFKTLVTRAASGKYYVFMVPVAEELDLKKAAAAAGEKSISMIKSKELLPLTGYIHGGCSPIGMKKQFDTFIHSTAEQFPTIIFSAGKIGFQVELAPKELFSLIPIRSADIIV